MLKTSSEDTQQRKILRKIVFIICFSRFYDKTNFIITMLTKKKPKNYIQIYKRKDEKKSLKQSHFCVGGAFNLTNFLSNYLSYPFSFCSYPFISILVKEKYQQYHKYLENVTVKRHLQTHKKNMQ